MKSRSRRVLATVLLLCACGPTLAADPPPTALRSPFIAPARFARTQPLQLQAPAATMLHLRATMIAKDWSMANVNGTMLMPGETINGYRLLQVLENEAIFVKDDGRVVVTIDDEH
jgi:hypothetical protein